MCWTRAGQRCHFFPHLHLAMKSTNPYQATETEIGNGAATRKSRSSSGWISTGAISCFSLPDGLWRVCILSRICDRSCVATWNRVMWNGFAGSVDVYFCRHTSVWLDRRICRMDWLDDLASRLVPRYQRKWKSKIIANRLGQSLGRLPISVSQIFHRIAVTCTRSCSSPSVALLA